MKQAGLALALTLTLASCATAPGSPPYDYNRAAMVLGQALSGLAGPYAQPYPSGYATPTPSMYTFNVQASRPYGRYAVAITRKDSNVYVDRSSRAVILTRFCFEFATIDDAILIWDGPYSSKVVFSGGATCEVKDVL